MTRTARLAALALVAALLAGCVDKGDDRTDEPPAVTVPDDWALRALSNDRNDDGSEHDHENAAHHADRSTPNFETLGWDPLITDHHGRSSGSYLCGDVSQGDQRIGVVHSHFTSVAFVVVDLSDPDAPRNIGELVMPNTFIYDIAVTPDARYVALATSDVSAMNEDGPLPLSGPGAAPDLFQGRPYFRDACGVRPAAAPLPADLPYSAGVVLVDMADPTQPVIVDYEPEPILGAHSVFATKIQETYYVLGAVTNLVHAASEFVLYTIEETPLGPQLVLASAYRPPPPVSPEQPLINGHTDGWIQRHPATGQLLAYLADWDGGLVIVDLSNLNAPVEIGRWSNLAGQDDFPYDDDSGSIHSVLPMSELWDDRHITFIGQEVVGRPDNTPTGVIYLMDTTDPTQPTPLSGWTLPVDPVWDDVLMYSTHYFTVAERTLFVTMYHGGLWAVNVTDPEAPDTVGVYIPANASPQPAGDLYPAYNWAPTVLDAFHLEANVLAVFDGGSGVYTVRFDPSVQVPDVAEWAVSLG